MDKNIIVVPHFEGVTTAIVAFVFVCVIFPHIVKNKTQFYVGFVSILLVILLHSLAVMLHTSPGFEVFAGAATCLLQMVAIVTLFLIPIIVVTFMLQNQLLRGVTFGTVRR